MRPSTRGAQFASHLPPTYMWHYESLCICAIGCFKIASHIRKPFQLEVFLRILSHFVPSAALCARNEPIGKLCLIACGGRRSIGSIPGGGDTVAWENLHGARAPMYWRHRLEMFEPSVLSANVNPITNIETFYLATVIFSIVLRI